MQFVVQPFSTVLQHSVKDCFSCNSLEKFSHKVVKSSRVGNEESGGDGSERQIGWWQGSSVDVLAAIRTGGQIHAWGC